MGIRHCSCLVLCIFLCACAARGEPAPQGPSDEAGIRIWTQKLGAAKFEDREAASKALRDIGLPARQALEQAAASDDPEVRMRAEDILASLRFGITAGTPEAMATLMRGYESRSQSEQADALSQIVAELKAGALPFLLQRISAGQEWELRKIGDQLRELGDYRTWRQVLETLKNPSGPAQASLLVQACAAAGTYPEIAAAMKAKNVSKSHLARLSDLAISRLRADKPDGETFLATARLLEEASSDPRFLYLQAAALRSLGKNEQAAALAEKALATGSQEEAPHYQIATLLEELDLRDMARAEWEKILALPPADGVYDINAWLRLGQLFAATNAAQAADAFEKALVLFRKEKETSGKSVGMVGSTEQDLADRVKRLRAAAESTKQPDQPALPPLELQLEAVLKSGSAKELAEAQARADVSLEVNVQPEGVRLFDLGKVSTFRYDPKDKVFAVLLNGSLCCTPVPFKTEKKTLLVELRSLDCVYHFSVDTATGKAKQVARYDYDYLLKIRPPPELQRWTGLTFGHGNETYDAKQAEAGIPLDYIPRKLEIEVSGTLPDGKPAHLIYSMPERKFRAPADKSTSAEKTEKENRQ